jgi:hypothetical protein
MRILVASTGREGRREKRTKETKKKKDRERESEKRNAAQERPTARGRTVCNVWSSEINKL